MAAADSQYTDLGIVLYMDVSPAGKTYVDRFGKTVDCEELTDEWTPMQGAQAVKSATHPVGIPAAHAYWVYVELGGGEVSVSVRLVSQYGNDAGAAPHVDAGWSRVQVVNQDDGTTANEHTLTATGYYLMQTASEHVSGRSRWEARANGGPEAAIVRIAGRAV